MFLIIFVVALILTLIYLAIRDKKHGTDFPVTGEFADMSNLSYEEKIQKYKDNNYNELSPILRTRF